MKRAHTLSFLTVVVVVIFVVVVAVDCNDAFALILWTMPLMDAMDQRVQDTESPLGPIDLEKYPSHARGVRWKSSPDVEAEFDFAHDMDELRSCRNQTAVECETS